jgi:NAD+ synthase (glutamine-hydrolysing)
MAHDSSTSLRIQLAQINTTVGAIETNTESILKLWAQAEAKGIDLLVLPELALCGYPPEDLLFRPALNARIQAALKQLQACDFACALLVGAPSLQEAKRFNAAHLIQKQRITHTYRKQVLPNDTVFDEKRYFTEGSQPCVFKIKGIACGVVICEDLWPDDRVMAATVQAGADLVLSLNASPFEQNKAALRMNLLQARSRAHATPIAYLNSVGGQDELVFDGGSCVVDGEGKCILSAPYFQTAAPVLHLYKEKGQTLKLCSDTHEATPEPLSMLYEALVLSVHDYVNKNRFPGVLIGLSGGIDSAVMLAIAVDALGPERVTTVAMPSQHTAGMSCEDAQEQASRLGVKHITIPIAPLYQSMHEALSPHFSEQERTTPGTTEQNLQARLRGMLLMGLSNKQGAMVLTTGNKSEMAVGYATLYGDMAGGFAALKDVFKTQVQALARWRNAQSQAEQGCNIIPKRVLDRPPSAELAPDQKDEDNLPPYPVLDRILKAYLDQNQSAQAILAESNATEAPLDPPTVAKVVALVNRNEYKRRQAPVGLRTSRSAFGKDRRYPITSDFARQ